MTTFLPHITPETRALDPGYRHLRAALAGGGVADPEATPLGIDALRGVHSVQGSVQLCGLTDRDSTLPARLHAAAWRRLLDLPAPREYTRAQRTHALTQWGAVLVWGPAGAELSAQRQAALREVADAPQGWTVTISVPGRIPRLEQDLIAELISGGAHVIISGLRAPSRALRATSVMRHDGEGAQLQRRGGNIALWIPELESEVTVNRAQSNGWHGQVLVNPWSLAAQQVCSAHEQSVHQGQVSPAHDDQQRA